MHFIDTHCHINIMVKSEFDRLLSDAEITAASEIIDSAAQKQVTQIINVGTNLIESENCLRLAKAYSAVFAVVGIHPTDCTPEWKSDVAKIKSWITQRESLKIVGIGECGIDLYHKPFDLSRQQAAFRTQIELALEHNLALVVHSRDAYDETLQILEEYKNEKIRGVMHCFSYDYAFAQTVQQWNFKLGIGGTITYPKNQALRDIVRNLPLSSFILETDAPFLPIQTMRGKQNHPSYIYEIGSYIAELRNESVETVAHTTTKNATMLFGLANYI